MLRGIQRYALLAAATAVLAGCASPPRPPAVDPDAVRAKIRGLMPATIANTEGWAIDIYAAFEVLSVPVTTEHICSVLAVTQQESNFQVDPAVPGLPALVGVARHPSINRQTVLFAFLR